MARSENSSQAQLSRGRRSVIYTNNMYDYNRRRMKRGDIHPDETRIDLSFRSNQSLVPVPGLNFPANKPTAAKENGNEKSDERIGQHDKSGGPRQPGSEHPEAQARHFSAKDFESFVWPLMKPKIMEMSENEIHAKIKALLDEEVASLRSLTRTPLLKANSTPEEYELYVRFLRDRLAQSPSVVAKSEAAMSMVMNLLPSLKASLSGLITETEPEEHVEQEPHDEREADEEQNEPVEQEEPPDQELADQGECIQEEDPTEQGEPMELETHVGRDRSEMQNSQVEPEEAGEHEEFEESEATTISDDDGSLYQDDPFDIDEEDNVVASIESHTPIVTPRLMTQLRSYEKKYSKALKSSKPQKRSRTTSSLYDRSATDTPSRHAKKRPRTPNNPVTQRQISELGGTPTTKDGELDRAAAKRRASETTPTPARSISKRLRLDWQPPEHVLDGQSTEPMLRGLSLNPTRDGQTSESALDKKSPKPTHSPASSCSDLPTLEELFSSSLGKHSSPARQSSTAPNLASTPASSIVKESEGDRSNIKPPVPRFSKEPGLFVTPSPVSASANKPFEFKRSASRNVRHTTPSQRESMPPSRYRETTADFKALDHSEKLMLLFKMSRGNRRG
ncbi:uncharacterized protein B0J16DRAFT_119153 [Fusarium flagelliforme]|uniref:uncharacterized protein n=1 Tax=Fusarium flagelliforme TaxID=2675880 RepID=UPI001E8D7A13|nr:uncharacterized protein B0J16DRAFT_119153 [Fusarium flagelliforme]KAH7189683.1 hypothetical protein B0J16DRAFT_119153 [Fusarium flagelliforme]